MINGNKQHKDNLKALDKIALKITGMVGTMYCAIIFSILAFISFPQAIQGGTATIISWIAQTFLQLVLLSIIMVGQNIQADHAKEVEEAHYKNMVEHDKKIERILTIIEKEK